MVQYREFEVRNDEERGYEVGRPETIVHWNLNMVARSLAQGTLRHRVLRPGKEHDDEAWRIYD